jgi:hypothetical protein
MKFWMFWVRVYVYVNVTFQSEAIILNDLSESECLCKCYMIIWNLERFEWGWMFMWMLHYNLKQKSWMFWVREIVYANVAW